MKRAVLFLLVIALLLPTSVLAVGTLTVVQEVFYVRPDETDESRYFVEVYAELKNTGDAPMLYNSGMVELYDRDGKEIKTVHDINIYDCYPPILDPGGVGYLFFRTTVEDVVDKNFIANYSLNHSFQTNNFTSKETVRIYPTEDSYVSKEYPYMTYKELGNSNYMMNATIKNDAGAQPDYMIIVYALYDKNGTLLEVDADHVYYHDDDYYDDDYYDERDEADSSGNEWDSITVRTGGGSPVSSWEEEGIEPARLETIAYGVYVAY